MSLFDSEGKMRKGQVFVSKTGLTTSVIGLLRGLMASCCWTIYVMRQIVQSAFTKEIYSPI